MYNWYKTIQNNKTKGLFIIKDFSYAIKSAIVKISLQVISVEDLLVFYLVFRKWLTQLINDCQWDYYSSDTDTDGEFSMTWFVACNNKMFVIFNFVKLQLLPTF